MPLSIAANTLVSTLGRAVGLVVSLVTLGYMASYLKPDGYGDYSTALAFGFIFNSLADLGLYSVLVRDISKEGADVAGLVSAAFTLRLIALVGLMALAIGLGFQFPYHAGVQLAIALMAFFYAFSSLGQVLMAVFQRCLRTDRAAIAELAGRLSQLGLVLLFIWLDAGLLGMAGGLALSALIGFIVSVYFARRLVPFGLRWQPRYWLKLLKESWPIALALVFVVMYFKLDTVILSLTQPSADVGIYNLGYQFLQALIFFPAMFAGLIMPFLSRHGITRPNDFHRVFNEALGVFIAFTMPLGVLLIARASDIVRLIDYHYQFPAAAAVLMILAPAIAAIYFGSLFSNGLIALYRQRTLLWIYGLGAVFNVGLNLYFIPRYSFIAASWTTLATEALVTALMIVMLRRAAAQPLSWGRLLPVGAASAILAIALGLTAGWSILLAAPLAGAVYAGALWLLGGLTRADLKFIKQSELG